MARPTDYKPEYCEAAHKLCLLGATDKELADFFGTSEQTLNAWKKRHPEFLESLKGGKEEADAKVAQSLYLQAIDGNTTAAIFWLKNRRKHHWRDKQEHEHTGRNGGPIETRELSEPERINRLIALLDAARARRTGQPADGDDAAVGADTGATD